MGQNESSFKQTYEETVSQLSSVQMGEISRRFNELYAKAGGPKGHVVDREAFSKYFNLPVAVGDRLFDAFDEKKNGKISFEEFVCGLTVVLHGSFHERCMLLFKVFNLNEDEGVSRTELTTMLSHILHSTHTILHTIGEGEAAVVTGEDTHETVLRIVNAAFTNCDITRTGKLLPLEFEYWLKRNPKILDSLLSFQTKSCTLGPLIMSPSEQLLSVSHDQPSPSSVDAPLVVTMNPASPTLFQIGESPQEEGPLSPDEERLSREGEEEGEGPLASQGTDELDEGARQEVGDSISHSSEEPSPLSFPSSSQPLSDKGTVTGTESVETLPLESEQLTNQIAIEPKQPTNQVAIEPEQPTNQIAVESEESTDQASGSIMLAESNLSIDMSCVARVTSSDKLGSPVLPTTSLEEVAMTTEQGENSSSLLLATTESPEKEAEPVEEAPPTFIVGDLQRVEEELEGVHLTPSVSDSVPDVTIDLEEGVEPVFSDEEVPESLEPNVSADESSAPVEVSSGDEEVSEEIYTAWIPSPRTQELLAQPQPTKDPSHLTCPALVADVKMLDAVSDLLSAHFPEEERKAQLTVEQVTMDTQGLRRLVAAGCLRAAVDLTARFLSAHGQGLGQAGQPTVHTHKTLQMWSARIALLMHLELFQEAERELVAFEELMNPDLYYQYHKHSYPNKAGSMVPFSLRLLHAQLPAHQNFPQLTLDRLCHIQSICEQVLAEVNHGRLPNQPHPLTSHDQQVAVRLWKKRTARVKCAMANTFVAIQDFQMAVEVYSSMLDLIPEQRSQILSLIGRLYLSLGDLKSAQKYFTLVVEEEEKHPSIVKVNEGLVNVFLSRWQIARECFEEAAKSDPTNLAIQSNISVCTFYQGRLKESIGEMERFVRSRPPSTLQPAVFGNLAAAFELESGNSQLRKLAFIPLLAAHTGDAFSLSPLNIR